MTDRLRAWAEAVAYRHDRWVRSGGEAALVRVAEWSVGVTLAGLLLMLAAMRWAG